MKKVKRMYESVESGDGHESMEANLVTKRLCADDTFDSSDSSDNEVNSEQSSPSGVHADGRDDDEDDSKEDERPFFGSFSSDSVAKETSGYTPAAMKMMAKMGYKKGSGLGKHGQGRVDIVEASKQRGRRGLGLYIQGLEASDEADWDFEKEEVIIDEEVEWLPPCSLPIPSLEELRGWKVIGAKKRTIDDETDFCKPEVLTAILNAKSVFDHLDAEEMRRARTRSNPYETIRGAFFLNRAAMKMANMDAILDFMFTQPKGVDNKPLVTPAELLYFVDICAGPGGFSEYVLWRKQTEVKGFGMTLRGANDFKLEDFFAGPPEMFEPHYGVGGLQGDGDIFKPENQQEFISFVQENSDGKGVHFVMADGGFSVEGQENIQEILSKQLYLCQFLVAISCLRTGGHFVCKLFDLFTRFSVGLVYLMYRIFDRVTIYKPVTSRPANSERYIVCRNLKSGIDAVKQYLYEINVDLNKYSGMSCTEDVNEIVPESLLEDDKDFYNYIHDSNVQLGIKQIQGLRKTQIFTQNVQLYESRQADTRKKCLERWKVPDNVRTKPGKSDPNKVFRELIQGEAEDYFGHDLTEFSPEMLTSIHTPYDFRCYVLGDKDHQRWYLLGLGRSHVFKWNGNPATKWRKLDENIRVELPDKTLIEVEFVQELKGEGMGQKRQMTIHALDALFLYNKDVRHDHFNERIEKLKKFVKAISKPTRSDLTPIFVPLMYRMEQIDSVFERLGLYRIKGSSQPRLCYSPPERQDGHMFLPQGVCIVKIVKDPWTIAMSASRGMKYFYNLHTRESVFQIPKESIATVRDTKLNSFCWRWKQGVVVHASQTFPPNPDLVQADDFVRCIQQLVEKLKKR